MSRQLFIDTRYEGMHGIARYAREVVPRIGADWTPMRGPYRPASPRGALDRHRLSLPRGALLYNPGFSSGPTRATQLLTVHDLTQLRVSDPRRRRLNAAYFDTMVRPAIRRAGHVMTVSTVSAAELRAWLDDDSIEVHNTSNGCSPDFRREGPAAARGRPYFLYVGHFREHKNPDPALAAIARLPDYDLIIVTSDTVGAVSLATKHGLRERTSIHSGIADEELAKLYRGAEALIFPSVWEGFGLPVLEALRCGTKVVYSSEATSVADICHGTQFGAPRGADADAFEQTISAALEAQTVQLPDLSRYDWDNVAGVTSGVIDRLLGGTQRN